MFGRKKMYKRGLADAMAAYEAFGEKQAAALEKMREEVRSGNKKLETALVDLGENINGIYDYLTSQEKATLYHLSTPMDIKQLDIEEKRLLLAVLYQLAYDEGPEVTEEQRSYLRSIQRYLEVTNPQTEVDLSAVENLDSLEVQKAFLQVALEFFYLRNSDEISDEEEDFLGNFSVNRKQAALVENQVSRLHNAVGAQGLAEKYGYVPSDEDCNEQSQKTESCASNKTGSSVSVPTNAIPLREEDADEIIRLFPKYTYLETDNYVLILSDLLDGYNFRFDKKEHTFLKFKCSDLRLLQEKIRRDFISPRRGVALDHNTVYYTSSELYANEHKIYKFDIGALTTPQLVLNSKGKDIAIWDGALFFVDQSGLKRYSIEKGTITVLIPDIQAEWRGGAVYATEKGLYFSYDDPQNVCEQSVVAFYSFESKTSTTLFKSFSTIHTIPFADSEKIYAVYENGSGTVDCAVIKYSEIQPDTIFTFNKTLDLWDSKDVGLGSSRTAYHFYEDIGVYVSKSKELISVELKSENTDILAKNVLNHFSYMPVSFPAPLYCLGNWVYYESDQSSGQKSACEWSYTFFKVSLDQKGNMEELHSYLDCMGLDRQECEHMKRENAIQEVQLKSCD